MMGECRKLASVWLSLLLVATPASAGEVAEPLRLPTEMCRGFFLLPVTLAPRKGYPEDRTLWFLYDTGASNSYVDPGALERVSRRRIETGTRVDLVDATLGSLKVRRLPAKVANLEHLSLALGRPIDGLLAFEAFEAFEDYLVTLDYAAGTVRLERGELPEPDGRRVFDAKGRDERPWIDVNMGGQAFRLLIDSGAAGTPIAVGDFDGLSLESPPRKAHTSTRFSKVVVRRGARLAGEARIGPHVIDSPRLEETDGTPLVGGEIMRHFSWTFDQKHKRVRIEPLDTGRPITVPPHANHGIVSLGRDGRLELIGTLPDSPAEAAGLEKGDLITHLDGRPVADRGCMDYGGGQALTVRFLRDGEPRHVTLELEEMIP